MDKLRVQENCIALTPPPLFKRYPPPLFKRYHAAFISEIYIALKGC
jgi:hypothetical protein